MTQSEQGTNQTTKIVLGALAILAMAAALYWYFSGMRQDTVQENSQVIVEPVETGNEVITESGTVTPLPSLSEPENNEGTDVILETDGINPDIPLASVPNTNPFTPLKIESGDSTGLISSPSNANTTFNTASTDYDSSPSFSAPSAPVSTPSSNFNSNLSDNTSDWEFDNTKPVTLERPSGSMTSSNTDNVESDWDFGSAGADNSGDSALLSSSQNNTTSTQPSGIIAGIAPQDLPKDFGGTRTQIPNKENTSIASASNGQISSSKSGTDFIRQYGAASVAAPDDGTRLSRTLSAQDYHFTGAVLGSTNTAIFKSKNGFNVLEEGEKLPGTEVAIRTIDENRVVLALGEETVTLDLESLEKF